MAWGAIGAAAGAVIGAAITAGVQSGEASKTRRWAREMRSTAFQATMKDMKKAGLNPILISRQGPSSAPQGAMAQIPNFGTAAAEGMRAGVSAAKVKPEQKALNAQADANNAAAVRSGTQAELDGALKVQAETQAAANVVSAKQETVRTKLLETELPGRQAEQGMDESWFGKGTRHIRRASQAIQGLDARKTRRGR